MPLQKIATSTPKKGKENSGGGGGGARVSKNETGISRQAGVFKPNTFLSVGFGGFLNKTHFLMYICNSLGSAVQIVDNAICWINHYPSFG